MKIDSPRFGTLDVEPSKIIDFPRGLPGFEDLHRYALLHPESPDATPPYFILQSIDDPAVAFHIADPAFFGLERELILSDEDAALIQLDDAANAITVVMLLKSGDDRVRANLNAPLVLNIDARLGVQHVFPLNNAGSNRN